jgi:hypothetical protein
VACPCSETSFLPAIGKKPRGARLRTQRRGWVTAMTRHLTVLAQAIRKGRLSLLEIHFAEIGCCAPLGNRSNRSSIAHKRRHLADYESADRPITLLADKRTGLPR